MGLYRRSITIPHTRIDLDSSTRILYLDATAITIVRKRCHNITGSRDRRRLTIIAQCVGYGSASVRDTDHITTRISGSCRGYPIFYGGHAHTIICPGRVFPGSLDQTERTTIFIIRICVPISSLDITEWKRDPAHSPIGIIFFVHVLPLTVKAFDSATQIPAKSIVIRDTIWPICLCLSNRIQAVASPSNIYLRLRAIRGRCFDQIPEAIICERCDPTAIVCLRFRITEFIILAISGGMTQGICL